MPTEITFSNNDAIEELQKSFLRGPIIDEKGRRLSTAAQVARVNGLKIEIFADEHPPPHFRVRYQGETANYTIKDCTQINGGLGNFFRNVRAWHRKHKQLLIDEWNKMRPTDCPVGLYQEDAANDAS